MLNQIREYFHTMYNPDPQALKIIAISSIFILLLFISNPNFENIYYIFGLLLTIITIILAIFFLAIE